KKTEVLDADVAQLETSVEQTYAALRIAMLERWPVLDDPWHPDFTRTIAQSSKDIMNLLEHSPKANAYKEARERIERRALAMDDLKSERALVERIVRAYENLELARKLRAQGGEKWNHYRELLRCERSSFGK